MSLEETLDVAFRTECDFCNKELYTGRRMIYFQCIDCRQPTKICLDCFVSGMTYGNHKADHRVRIRGLMKAPSWSEFWTSDDDVIFLSILLQTHRLDFAAQAVGFTSTLAKAHLNYLACKGDLYKDIAKMPSPLTYTPELYFLQKPAVACGGERAGLRKRFIRVAGEKIRPFEFKSFSSQIEIPRYVGVPTHPEVCGDDVTRKTPTDYALGYFPMRLDLTTPPISWIDVAIVGIQALSNTFTKVSEKTSFGEDEDVPQPYTTLRYISMGYRERFLRRAALISMGYGISNSGYPFVPNQINIERETRDRDRDKGFFLGDWTMSSGTNVGFTTGSSTGNSSFGMGTTLSIAPTTGSANSASNSATSTSNINGNANENMEAEVNESNDGNDVKEEAGSATEGNGDVNNGTGNEASIQKLSTQTPTQTTAATSTAAAAATASSAADTAATVTTASTVKAEAAPESPTYENNGRANVIGWGGSVEVDGRRVPIQLSYSAVAAKYVFSWVSPSTTIPGRPPHSPGFPNYSRNFRKTTTPGLSISPYWSSSSSHSLPQQKGNSLLGGQHASTYNTQTVWPGCYEYKDIILRMLEQERIWRKKELSKYVAHSLRNIHSSNTDRSLINVNMFGLNLPSLSFYNYSNLGFAKNLGFSTNPLATPSAINASPGILLCACAWLIEYFKFSKSAYGLSSLLRSRIAALLHSSLGRTIVRCGVGPSSAAKLLGSHALEYILLLARNTLLQVLSNPAFAAFKQQRLQQLHNTTAGASGISNIGGGNAGSAPSATTTINNSANSMTTTNISSTSINGENFIIGGNYNTYYKKPDEQPDRNSSSSVHANNDYRNENDRFSLMNEREGRERNLYDISILSMFPKGTFSRPDNIERPYQIGVVSDLTVRSITRVAEEAVETEMYDVNSTQLVAAIGKAYEMHRPGMLDLLAYDQIMLYKMLIEEKEKVFSNYRQTNESKYYDGADHMSSAQRAGTTGGLLSSIGSSGIGELAHSSGLSGGNRIKGTFSSRGKQNGVIGYAFDSIQTERLHGTQLQANNAQLMQMHGASRQTHLSVQSANPIAQTQWMSQYAQMMNLTASLPFASQIATLLGSQTRGAGRQQMSLAISANPVFYYIPRSSPVLIIIFSLFGSYLDPIQDVPTEVRNFGEKFVNTEMAKRILYGISKNKINNNESSATVPLEVMRSDGIGVKNNKEISLIKHRKLASSKTYFAEAMRALFAVGRKNVNEYVRIKREMKSNLDPTKKVGNIISRLPRANVYMIDSAVVRELVDNYLPGVTNDTRSMLFGQKVGMDGNFQEDLCVPGSKHLVFIEEPRKIPLPEVLLILLSGIKYETYLKLRKRVVLEIIYKWPSEFIPTPPRVPGERKRVKPRLKKTDAYNTQEIAARGTKERDPITITDAATTQIERFLADTCSFYRDVQPLPQIPATKYCISYPGISEVLSIIIRMELDCNLVKAVSFLDYEKMLAIRRDEASWYKKEDTTIKDINPPSTKKPVGMEVRVGVPVNNTQQSEGALNSMPRKDVNNIKIEEISNNGSALKDSNNSIQAGLQTVAQGNGPQMSSNSEMALQNSPSVTTAHTEDVNIDSKPLETSVVVEDESGDTTIKRKVSSKLTKPEDVSDTEGAGDEAALSTSNVQKEVEEMEPGRQLGSGEEEKRYSEGTSVPSIFSTVPSIDLLSIRAPLVLCDFSTSRHVERHPPSRSRYVESVERRIGRYFGSSGQPIRQLFVENRLNYGYIYNDYNAGAITNRLILAEADPLYQNLLLDDGAPLITQEQLDAIGTPVKTFQGHGRVQVPGVFTPDAAVELGHGPPKGASGLGAPGKRTHSGAEQYLGGDKQAWWKESIVKVSCLGLTLYYQHLMVFNSLPGLKNRFVAEYNESLRSRYVHHSSEVTEAFATLLPDLRHVLVRHAPRL